MKAIILLITVLLSLRPPISAQATRTQTTNTQATGAPTTNDCAVQDCTPFLNLVQNCGVDLSPGSTQTSLSSVEDRCICNSKNSQKVISTCLACMKISTALGPDEDTFSDLCPAARASGSRTCSAFGSAPYAVGGLMAGLGLFAMAT